MKFLTMRDAKENRSFRLSEDQVVTFDLRRLQITCTDGLIWITWPDGNERVLKKDQTAQIVSKGIVGIQALAAGSVLVSEPKRCRRPGLPWPFRQQTYGSCPAT